MKGARQGLTTDSENTNRVVVRVKCKSECYLGKIMAPIVKTSPSYIKESQHAPEIFRDFNFLGQNNIISLWI